MKKNHSTLVVGVLLGFVAGGFALSVWSRIQTTDLVSQQFALETALRREIASHRTTHGEYPVSLDPIQIDWLAEKPDRRALLLRDFYYERRGTNYVLWWHRQFE
jgi:hypothetical protein